MNKEYVLKLNGLACNYVLLNFCKRFRGEQNDDS